MGRSLAMPTLSIPPTKKNPTCLRYRAIYLCTLVFPLAIAVLSGGCEPPIGGCEPPITPQCWRIGGRRGSGMVPFERPLVSSYGPSIVTFPPSLHVSEILPTLFSRTPFLCATAYATAGICHANSVRLSVRHTRVLYQNG